MRCGCFGLQISPPCRKQQLPGTRHFDHRPALFNQQPPACKVINNFSLSFSYRALSFHSQARRNAAASATPPAHRRRLHRRVDSTEDPEDLQHHVQHLPRARGWWTCAVLRGADQA
jgi:hypothetical protein